MKITKSELKQIIKEEALKFKKKLQLESQLAEVEQELAEVTAGNMHELPDGTKKWKPEFEKLSKDGGYPALKEEEACEEGDAVEEGDEPLNEVAVLAVLAGIGALVGGSVGLASLEMKAEEAAKGKIEDKPIYKAFRKVQQAATGMSDIKKGNMYEGDDIGLEAAAEVAEENPEAPEAKEMVAAMKELEAAAKGMSDEDKGELKAENEGLEEVVVESIDNSKSVLTEEKNRMKQLAGLL